MCGEVQGKANLPHVSCFNIKPRSKKATYVLKNHSPSRNYGKAERKRRGKKGMVALWVIWGNR